MTTTVNDSEGVKLVWIDPVIQELTVDQTFGNNRRGGDFSVHVDCTHS